MRIRKVEKVSAMNSIDQDRLVIILCSIILLIDAIKSRFGGEVDENYIIYEIPENYRNICYDEIDREKFKDTNFDKAIKHFLRVVTSKVQCDDLSNLRENFKNLEIVESKSLITKLRNKNNDAFYESDKIKITILGDNFDCIYHELLHFAAGRKIGNIYYGGFYQANEDTEEYIGHGLDEGYTVVMAERLFNDKHVSDSYWCLKEIVEQLEEIIGKDLMQHFYFTSDLYSLKEELKKYVSEEEIIAFLRDLDDLCYYTVNSKVFFKNKGYAEFNIQNIQNFLIKCNVRKIFLKYEDEDISKAKQFRKEINKYLQTFYENYYLFNEDIVSTSYERVQLSVDEALLASMEKEIVRTNKADRN